MQRSRSHQELECWTLRKLGCSTKTAVYRVECSLDGRDCLCEIVCGWRRPSGRIRRGDRFGDLRGLGVHSCPVGVPRINDRSHNIHEARVVGHPLFREVRACVDGSLIRCEEHGHWPSASACH